jgi:ribosomal protein S11
MAANNKKVTKKRVVSIEAHGQVHIKASFNNVIISITNQTGQVVRDSAIISSGMGKGFLCQIKTGHPRQGTTVLFHFFD